MRKHYSIHVYDTMSIYIWEMSYKGLGKETPLLESPGDVRLFIEILFC